MNEDQILSEIEKTLSSLDNAALPMHSDLNVESIDAILDTPGRMKSGVMHGFTQPVKIILILTVLLNILTIYTVFSMNSSRIRHQQLVYELKNDLKMEQSQNLY